MIYAGQVMGCVRGLAIALLLVASCGDDGTEADRLGIGAECLGSDRMCDEETGQVCLSQFKGGYCGLEGCDSDDDCPDASACILHEDNRTYCFRICADKVECNENRSVDNESNCSSNVNFVDGAQGRKACTPPSN